MKYFYYLLFWVMLAPVCLQGQQLPLVYEYRTNGFIVNPAMPIVQSAFLDATPRYKMVAGTTYRNQWGGLATTHTPYFQTYLKTKSYNLTHIWLGVHGMFDQVGMSESSNQSPTQTNGIFVTGSLHRKLGLDQDLYFGMSLGYIDNTLNITDQNFLSTDNAAGNIEGFQTNYPQVGVGFMYSSKAFYLGFSMPKIVDINPEGTSSTRVFPHYYGVFGGNIYTNNDKLLIRPEVWLRHAYDDFRTFNFSDRTWLFDIGVNARYELTSNMDNYLLGNLSIDSNYSARLGVGVVTKVTSQYDLKFGATYGTPPRFFQIGGTFELSLAILMRSGETGNNN